MSAAATLLPLPVAIVLGTGLIAPLLAKIHPRVALAGGVLGLAGALGVLAYVDTKVFSGDGHVLVHYFGGDHPVRGKLLGIAFGGDPLGLAFATIAALLGLLILLSLLSEFGDAGKREIGGLTALILILVAALLGAALTADLINLFVWFEVAALCSYGLTGFFLDRPPALEAAFKNLVMTSTAGFTVFAGAGMLYASTGALNLGQLHDVLPHPAHRVDLVALALLAGGFATKAGLMPFHGWLPDAHPPVPGAVSALFSALMVNLGVIALGRLALTVFRPGAGGHFLGLLMGIGIVSALLGAALALVQNDLKRLLAWDTVSQIGIVVVGFATAEEKGVAGGVYHLLNHALFKAMLFLCAGAVVHATGLTNLSELGGLARRMPFITVAFTVATASLAGVPPLNGYASLGLIHDGLHHQPLMFAAAVVAQILAVAALGRACYVGFYRRRDDYEDAERIKTGMRISLIVLGAACVAFGVFAQLLVHRVAGPAAVMLLHGDTYAQLVLHAGGAVPHSTAEFDWSKVTDYFLAFGEIAVGLGLGAAYIRTGPWRPLEWLRRLHTGSVNDYATYSVVGFVISFVALRA